MSNLDASQWVDLSNVLIDCSAAWSIAGRFCLIVGAHGGARFILCTLDDDGLPDSDIVACDDWQGVVQALAVAS